MWSREPHSHARIELGANWHEPTEDPWDDHPGKHGTHRVSEIAAPRGDEYGVAGIISGIEGPNGQLCKVRIERVFFLGIYFSSYYLAS
jgi:hypothetical protein